MLSITNCMTVRKTLTSIVLTGALALGGVGCENNSNNNSNQQQINFPIEKILTISADEYCRNVGKELKDYRLIGIQGRDIQKVIPSGTEVVVGYDFDYAGPSSVTRQHESGTALVQKP